MTIDDVSFCQSFREKLPIEFTSLEQHARGKPQQKSQTIAKSHNITQTVATMRTFANDI